MASCPVCATFVVVRGHICESVIKHGILVCLIRLMQLLAMGMNEWH